MYIYFLQGVDGGPIKIGISKSIRARIKQIQANSPVQLRVIGLCRGTSRDEANFHKQFAEFRLHGEWFSDCEQIQETVNKVGICEMLILVQDERRKE